MIATSTTLLRSVRDDPSRRVWFQLVDVYAPMIRGWLHRYGVSREDANDIAQDVLVVVFRKLPEFQRQRLGAFRCWLRRITINCTRDHRRRKWRHLTPPGGDSTQSMLNQLEDPNSDLSRSWDQEHQRHLLNYALGKVRPELTDRSWTAFRRTALEGQSPSVVADELGMSANAVMIAKSRVTARLREKVWKLLCDQHISTP